MLDTEHRGGSLSGGGGGADPDALTSDAVIGDNEVVRGDDGARGTQGSLVTINDDGDILTDDAAGPALLNAVGTSTVPNVVLNRGNANVGLSEASGHAYAQVDAARSLFVRSPSAVIAAIGESGGVTGVRPGTNGGGSLGTVSATWATTFTNGLVLAHISTASAQYTADDQDHTIVLTAATAELILPPAADGTQKYLVQFTGATSRTVTPDSGTSDTVDVSSPTQNKHYWVQSDGVSHWKMVLMD
jgi:hypothetical protein